MKPFPRILSGTVVMACLAGTLMTSMGQDGPPPPPPPEHSGPPGGERGDRPGRDGSGREGRSSGFRGDRGRGDFFRNLSEEERTQVRVAFEKAWKNEAVLKAREALSEANDAYRKAIDAALAEADPEVPKILEKARPPGGPPMFSRMPDVTEADFAKVAAARLGEELPSWSRHAPRGDAAKELHGKLLKVTPVQDALKKLEQAPQDSRKEAWETLKDAYHAAAAEELGKLREAARERDGGGRPPGPPPGEGPDKRD